MTPSTSPVSMQQESRERQEGIIRALMALHEDRLVILDEVHRVPDLFQSLRGLIDRGRRKGKIAA